MILVLKRTVINSNVLKSLDILLKRPQFNVASRSLSIFGYKNQQKLDNESRLASIDPALRDGVSAKKLIKYLDEEKKVNGKLVYVGRLTSQLYRAKTLSLSSSVLGLLLLPFLNNTLSTSSLFSQAFVYGTTGFFIFVTPMFAQFLSRRYVSRLYYNYDEKKFKAVLFSFFMFEYKIEFGLDDVHVPELPGVFTTLQLKSSKRNLFVDLNTFSDVELVQKIYGYDKPFDAKKYSDKSDWLICCFIL